MTDDKSQGITYVEPFPEEFSALNVGFKPTCVTVIRPPSLPVEVNNDVIAEGAVVAICPLVLVVVMITGLLNVVLSMPSV
jgi:hypothetical protein